MEFGVRWGRDLSLLTNLRGLLEPYNFTRKIIGFDTFEGFSGTTSKDGTFVKENDLSVSENYMEYLGKLLDLHDNNSPNNHIKKISENLLRSI